MKQEPKRTLYEISATYHHGTIGQWTGDFILYEDTKIWGTVREIREKPITDNDGNERDLTQVIHGYMDEEGIRFVKFPVFPMTFEEVLNQCGQSADVLLKSSNATQSVKRFDAILPDEKRKELVDKNHSCLAGIFFQCKRVSPDSEKFFGGFDSLHDYDELFVRPMLYWIQANGIAEIEVKLVEEDGKTIAERIAEVRKRAYIPEPYTELLAILETPWLYEGGVMYLSDEFKCREH